MSGKYTFDELMQGPNKLDELLHGIAQKSAKKPISADELALQYIPEEKRDEYMKRVQASYDAQNAAPSISENSEYALGKLFNNIELRKKTAENHRAEKVQGLDDAIDTTLNRIKDAYAKLTTPSVGGSIVQVPTDTESAQLNQVAEVARANAAKAALLNSPIYTAWQQQPGMSPTSAADMRYMQDKNDIMNEGRGINPTALNAAGAITQRVANPINQMDAAQAQADLVTRKLQEAQVEQAAREAARRALSPDTAEADVEDLPTRTAKR
jgi:hypothetical protein